MTLEIIGISVLWTFLFGYILIGAIDFGAGFFNAYSLTHRTSADFDEHHPTLFITGLGSDKCIPSVLFRRDYRFLPEDGILLRNDSFSPCQYRNNTSRDPWFVLCI